jgi:hypothetical protein
MTFCTLHYNAENLSQKPTFSTTVHLLVLPNKDGALDAFLARFLVMPHTRPLLAVPIGRYALGMVHAISFTGFVCADVFEAVASGGVGMEDGLHTDWRRRKFQF